MIATIPPVQAPAWVRNMVWVFNHVGHDFPLQFTGFRRRHPWLHDATTTVVLLSNHLLAYRATEGDKAIVATLNVDDQLRTAQLDAPFGSRLQATSPPADLAVLEVPSHGWEVAF